MEEHNSTDTPHQHSHGSMRWDGWDTHTLAPNAHATRCHAVLLLLLLLPLPALAHLVPTWRLSVSCPHGGVPKVERPPPPPGMAAGGVQCMAAGPAAGGPPAARRESGGVPTGMR
jgi:hypothetical protein